MFHNQSKLIWGVIMTAGLGFPALADSLKAGTDLVARSEHSSEDICAALLSLGLYLDQHRQIILAHARTEIDDRTSAEAESAFDRRGLDDARVRDLIGELTTHRLAKVEGKLQITTDRLQGVYADGCLRVRSTRPAPNGARSAAEPGIELAAVREDVQELSRYAPAEFRTPVFRCVGDFETCRVAISDEFGCGITFMICVGQQLIPFTAN